MKEIKQFQGKQRWLSNFAPCLIVLDGMTFPSVENAYQAAKTLSVIHRKRIQGVSAGDAKKMGKKVPKREDWDDIKLEIMEALNKQKYGKEPYRSLLLETEDAYIEEGNWWGDTFWGTCKGEGKNHLGKIIMRIREGL